MTLMRGGRLGAITLVLLAAMLLAPAGAGGALTFTYLTNWGGAGTAPGDLDVPWSVSVDNKGYVYTTEYMVSLHRVQRFTSGGTPQLDFGVAGSSNGQFNIPNDTAIAPNGDIYVADQNNDRIAVFDSSGTWLRNLGSAGTGDGQFDAPGAVEIGKFGYVYVTDDLNDRVQVLDSVGNFVRKWGSSGSTNGAFDQPTGIALDPLGYVYVADSNNDRVQKFDALGNYVTQWGTTGTGNGQFDYPYDIDCDPWGRVYVADFNNDRVQVFDSAGTYLGQFGSSGSANGQFNIPAGVDADAYRNVYVADTWNNRVQKFDAPQPTYVWAGAGDTRIDTAIKVSEYGWPVELLEDADGQKSAIIATAYNWPDALAAGALAGAVEGPILLVEQNSLPSAVAAELGRLGATRVYVVGGEGVVSEGVFDAVEDLPGIAATRLGGANRYETSEIIAAEVKRILGSNYDGSAFVATGNTFPDALSAAPLSYAGCWPILLARSSGLPDGMDGVQRVAILGGDMAVSPEVEDSLSDALDPENVTRIEGPTRYETAIEIAYWGVQHAGLTFSHTAIATGQNFPDALAGGPLQGRYKSVILLTPTSSAHSGVQSTVQDEQRGIGELRFIGGTSAVSQPVRDLLWARLLGPYTD